MTEPSNAVLADRLEKLTKDFHENRKEVRDQLREMDRELELTQRSNNELNISMTYIKDTVKEMKDLLNGFVKVQNTQNETINDFVNSDGRRTSKNTFLSTIYQATLLFVATLIGYWLNGGL